MKARIYINRHIVAANKKATKEKGQIVDEAAIAINTYLGSIYAKEVEFSAGSKLIQNARKARCSGATIWIETEFESLVIDGVKANRAMLGENMERQELVDDSIFELLQKLSPKPLPKQTDVIASIREVIEEILVDYYQVCSEQEFYPKSLHKKVEIPIYVIGGSKKCPLGLQVFYGDEPYFNTQFGFISTPNNEELPHLYPQLGETLYYRKTILKKDTHSLVIAINDRNYLMTYQRETYDGIPEGGKLIFELTEESVTPSNSSSDCHDIAVFEQPCFLQNEYFLVYRGKAMYPLLTLFSDWGDAGNENLFIALDNSGNPCFAVLEASCH